MPGNTPPPFRADHIGGLLRPRALRDAFRAHAEDRISAADFAVPAAPAGIPCAAVGPGWQGEGRTRWRSAGERRSTYLVPRVQAYDRVMNVAKLLQALEEIIFEVA
jgi:hypothetical protein